LAKVGAVEKVIEPTPSRRARKTAKSVKSAGAATALVSGRRKTVYRITSAGEEAFLAMLEETAAAVDAEHFTLKLAFFRYLQPETRLALLERRRAYLQEKLQQFKLNLKNYRERIDSYTLSLQTHGMAATENDIAWIEELINKERAPEGPRPETSNA
jgi:DNA-binding PadR family transcriptional regulator